MLGCDSGPSLAQVTGTVTYQGKPLDKGTIVFEVSGTRSAFGTIENGQIVDVSTFKSGDGAPTGEARVAVNSYDDGGASVQQASPDGQNAPGGASRMVVGKSLIPAKYSNPATSDLQVTIQPGKNVVELDLAP
ncbi:hypothetical protein C5Y96_06635 [Blastopirellula marina]|uniref:Carboxypeptidase regulatory-like domain-containing protein n=2 Tax=Pirellulales TaxID=2691354 RepID=A0A2S8FXD0_9BACT|nr:hypothetical protein C5Y96_06635 [Blastopirellula marina]RCS53552.1 hypothetical protein DTL36_06645 [Bremerella cremea]